MAVTIEEAKAFITDAEKSREPWFNVAKRSWQEIKKRRTNGNLWSISPQQFRRAARYPAWYSILKIRQPLVLSRLGEVICKDTTPDGNDEYGATAAIIKERLARGIAKSFPMFDVMCSNRDDFLITNFAMCCAYYSKEDVKERVKEYILPQQVIGPNGEETVVFLDANGKDVGEKQIIQDDEGWFIYTNKVVDVEKERVYLEPHMYGAVYVDPNITRWERCKRLAFENSYSEPEFKEIFGTKAFLDLSRPDINPNDSSQPKRQTIKVFTYWDYYERECYWFAENGSEFIKPKSYLMPDPDAEGDYKHEYLNGLYDLERFFPCPAPLIMNSATDEFWPIPEYYQLMEFLDEIHAIFTRMMETTRAYRARLLFDSSVEGLEEAMKELPESGAIGVVNLAKALASGGGDIKNVAQYVPTDGVIASLQQLYISLEQRLNTIYRLTGTSDMLQGLASDQTQRTFGERQMTEKYALNQLEEPQSKMAEYVRDCYELLTEMALKNFVKDESFDTYIMPSTLQPGDKERYGVALQLLKDDSKRFRIELETDSTIALSEQYTKQASVELVNTLTAALEHTAAISQSNPDLAKVELHALKYLIQSFRQGKLFQTEITEAIDNVIRKAEEAALNITEPFNKDEVMARLKAQEDKASNDIEIFKIQSSNQIKQMEMAQTERLAGLRAQLEAMKTNAAAAKDNSAAQMDYQQLVASITKSREELAFRREELLLEFRKFAGEQEVAKYKLMLDDRFGTVDAQLAQTQQFLEKQYQDAEMQERWATETRLQSEHRINEAIAQIDMLSKLKGVSEESQPQVTQPGVVINPPAPPPTTVKSTKKVELDKKGRVVKMENTNMQSGA